jgi:hypothetical protein
MKKPQVGQKIFVPSQLFLSHGSDDFAGGEATISRVYEQYGSTWVEIAERTDHVYNWDIIGLDQAKLRKEYKGQKAHPDPDIDTPWIEEGDTVNGEVYHGPSIW